MFAGPNGSGKSTLNQVVHPPARLGYYLNADEIERNLLSGDGLNLDGLPFDFSETELREFMSRSEILANRDPGALTIDEAVAHLPSSAAGGYHAAAISEFIRQKLLEARITFSFETVMSHPSKIELLRSARQRGYRTYLYYIATEDPEINVARVEAREKQGGHGVPVAKIRERYVRSLDLLADAIAESNRAFIFDNSTEDSERVWFTEFEDGDKLLLKVEPEEVPLWFHRAVFDKIIPRLRNESS